MRRLLAVIAFLILAAPASAQDMSANVQRVASIPALKSAIAINFIEDAMFVSTAVGVYSFDISDPASPQPLGALPMFIWENEDMDVDVKRKRLFISRDPRGFTTPATPGSAFPVGAVHIIDVSDPHVMEQVGFFTLGAGHTSSCVNACDFLWTAGPGANAQTQPPDWKGRPIFATDVRDPANPKPCPAPIDLGRNDGVTDYVHDVQVDSRGVAWVSGAGGVRGYWTSGEHRNPLTGRKQVASACDPVPYAGSGTPADATPSRFMHNSFRDPGATRARARISSVATAAKRKRGCARHKKAKARKRCRARRRQRERRDDRRDGGPPPGCEKAKGKAKGCDKQKDKPRKPDKPDKPKPPQLPQERPMRERVLYGTEENLSSDCTASGRFVTYDLEGTFDGEGFRDIANTKHRMRVLDTWTPENQDGADGCASAHYFASRGDGIFANSFYGQGVRFLDVSDPRSIRQVGWYRPSDSNAFATYWRDGLVYLADFTRGVEILEFTGTRRSPTVRTPRGAPAQPLRFDRSLYRGLCPLPGSANL